MGFFFQNIWVLYLIGSRCYSTCWGNNEEREIEDPCFRELSILGEEFRFCKFPLGDVKKALEEFEKGDIVPA